MLRLTEMQILLVRRNKKPLTAQRLEINQVVQKATAIEQFRPLMHGLVLPGEMAAEQCQLRAIYIILKFRHLNPGQIP